MADDPRNGVAPPWEQARLIAVRDAALKANDRTRESTVERTMREIAYLDCCGERSLPIFIPPMPFISPMAILTVAATSWSSFFVAWMTT